MPNSLENQFIADTFKSLIHTGNVSLSSGSPKAIIYSGDGFASSLSISTASNGIDVSGDATIDGNVISAGSGSFLDSLSSGNHTVNGNSTISGNTTIAGNSTISGGLSSGNHTVNGNSTISGNTTIAGNSTISGGLSSGNHTVNGNSTISGGLSSGNHTVNGNSTISGGLSSNVLYAKQYLNLPKTDSREDIVNHIFPIGSIFFSFESTNPSIRFTGTNWSQVSQGRFIVGVGRGNDGIRTRQFTPGDTFGEYAHTLTENEMPEHTHVIPNGGGAESDSGSGDKESPTIGNNGISGKAGGNDAHENTPPGFALYIWKRES